MSNFSKCLLAFLILLLPAAAHAADGSWVIREVSGKVRLEAPAAAAQPASVSDAVPLGASLTTGGDGRVVLFNGKQEIVMGPNSRMTVPVDQKGAFTRILQDLGTLMFKVDKRPEQHFEVETPMIAAVVKGTTFAVTAGAATDSVYVAEGLVEVSTRNGAGRTLVPAGTTALVSHANPSVIDVQTSNPTTVTSAPATGNTASTAPATSSNNASAVVSAPIGAATPDYGRLSNGLVQTPAANPSAQVSARGSNAPGAQGVAGNANVNANARSAVSLGNPAARGRLPNDGLNGSRALIATNAGGNGNGIGNSNAGGNGNGNGAGNGNAGGNGNGNAGGNSGVASAGNGNAGGNGNGNAGGNSSVASAGNSNAGGNGNVANAGNGNSNAGGNGSASGSSNSNAGGNSSASGSSNSNAGGNGNSNSNAGGNGKGK